MADRIASDHPTIDSIRAEVVRHGGRRRRLKVPASERTVVPGDGVIEVIVDERTCFARCQEIRDQPAIVGLYDTMAAAKDEVTGSDWLVNWLDDNGHSIGSSVLLDVLQPGKRIGLRSPGDRAVYDVPQSPDNSLAEIARDLSDER